MKIYTYANPLDLDCASFWDEVREYPHLCISRTLVQGLVMKFGRTTFQYIDTIQSFMDCFYKTWEDEPQNNIAQYVSISEKTNGIKDPSIKKAMKFNKGQVFEAIRMLFELDLDADKFDGSALTEEQAVLLDIYKDLQGERCWEVIRKLSTKTAEQVNNAIITILDSEIRKELSINLQEDIKEAIDERISKVEKELASLVPLKEDSKRRALINKLGLYNHYKKLNTKRDFIQHKKIVFHGVHQFTPIILRLISHLKTLGFEIIFLFNYNRQFKRVYDTWNRIYGNFRPGIKPDVVCNMNRSANKEIGTALGELLDGLPVQKYKLTERVQVFDNLTSFTDYVAKEYEEAKKNAGRGKSVLAQMNKQFYGVQSKEVNEMLKTQFPEQFGERHFLAHPIGGFILGLYNMWNTQEGVLKIDEANLKECLSANLWRTDPLILDNKP
jgi:hypothetical protein